MKDIILCPKDIYELLKEEETIFRTELILLNSRNEITWQIELSENTLQKARINPKEILRQVITRNAASFILVQFTPKISRDVKEIKRLRRLSKTLDIRFLDYIIISKDNYYSFYECGKM